MSRRRLKGYRTHATNRVTTLGNWVNQIRKERSKETLYRPASRRVVLEETTEKECG